MDKHVEFILERITERVEAEDYRGAWPYSYLLASTIRLHAIMMDRNLPFDPLDLD